ncbi:Ribosomal protein S8 family protein [Capsicum annuum]|nr:Ribosomal protein S8 family protein [Capsicum annuum]
MMNSVPPTGHSEGQSTTRPPLFDGTHFIWWKARMEMFIQGKDYELWDRIIEGNLRTYEMEVDGNKEQKTSKKILALKASDSDEEIELDKEQIAFITKNLSKFFKKKKGTGSKKRSNNNPNGYYKCGMTDHQIRECPLWEIEWRKERVENEQKARRKEKEEHSMIDAWGSDLIMMMMDLASLKFDFIDLKVCKQNVDKENCTLKKQITLLELSNNDLKSKILKLTLTDHGKKVISKEQENVELELTKYKQKCYDLTEKMDKMSQEEKVKGNKRHWYLDSACSRHMTSDKKKFLSLSKIDGEGVSFGNGKRGIIPGVGKISSSQSKAVEDVYLVEGLKHNLLIILQLCDKSNKVILTAAGPELTCLSAIETDPLLWHRRLGYASLKQLNILSSKDIVLGLPKIKLKEEKLCSACEESDTEEQVTKHVPLTEAVKLGGTFTGGTEAEGTVLGGTEPSTASHQNINSDLTARLEAIRLLVAFASYMEFILYQMDVKSGFLNGILKEEVFVKQPLGFESREFPDHVYKMDKAFYGLKQEPRAWYKCLSKFLLEHGHTRGTMIHQQKYVKELLKKFSMEETKEISTSIATATKLDLDETGSNVEQKLYRGYSDDDYAEYLVDRKRTKDRSSRQEWSWTNQTQTVKIDSEMKPSFVAIDVNNDTPKHFSPVIPSSQNPHTQRRKQQEDTCLKEALRVPKPGPSISSALDSDYLSDTFSMPPDDSDIDINIDTPADTASQSDHERHIVASFLDLTLMGLLDSEIPIDFPQLIIKHMERLLVKDKNGHALPYHFWLVPVFDDFCVCVKVWSLQITKDVIGQVNYDILSAAMRYADNPMQKL